MAKNLVANIINWFVIRDFFAMVKLHVLLQTIYLKLWFLTPETCSDPASVTPL